MKKVVILFVSFFMNVYVYAQLEITEKGYFYSPDGFVCAKGSIYTADMKTMVRRGYSTKDSFTDNQTFVGSYWDLSQSLVIPAGCTTIPSNIIYMPSGNTMAGRNGSHSMGFDVYIPSSVQYIAVDAFMSPYVRFFNSDSNSTAQEHVEGHTNITEVARYNLQGEKINIPERGINIVQMSNETTRKELVK